MLEWQKRLHLRQERGAETGVFLEELLKVKNLIAKIKNSMESLKSMIRISFRKLKRKRDMGGGRDERRKGGREILRLILIENQRETITLEYQP